MPNNVFWKWYLRLYIKEDFWLSYFYAHECYTKDNFSYNSIMLVRSNNTVTIMWNRSIAFFNYETFYCVLYRGQICYTKDLNVTPRTNFKFPRRLSKTAETPGVQSKYDRIYVGETKIQTHAENQISSKKKKNTYEIVSTTDTQCYSKVEHLLLVWLLHKCNKN